MRNFRFGQAVIGATFLFLSCSSSSGGTTRNPDGGSATCMQVSACGGDLVGTWRIVQSCLTATADLTTCAGATTQVDFVIGGSVTYNADGTYSSTPTAGAATYHEHFPPGCMPYGLTCDQLGHTLADGGTMTTGTCSTDSTGACDCVGQEPEKATNEAGTYVISSSTVTSTHDGGTSSGGYCVRGNMLYVIAQPRDGALNPMGNIVLVKQ